jgi:hypothetical protein
MCVLPVSAARAQVVGLDLQGCAEPAPADVRALATLELRGRLRQGGDADAELHIVVSCTGERAELRAVEPGDVRSVALGSVPVGLRARLLALAIAELASVPGGVRTTPAEVSAPDQTATPPPRLYLPSASRPERTTRPRSAAIVAAGASLSVAPVVGGAASVSSLVRVVDRLSFTGALRLGQTRTDIDGGRVRLRSLVLRSGPATTVERARWLGYAGLAARVELLELAGGARAASLFRAARVRTFVIGPALFAGVLLALGGHAVLGLEAELAHLLRAVDVEVRGGQTRTLSPWRLTLDALVGLRW